MSRADYSDDCETWSLIRWRGAVNSAINGRRGQAFLKDMLAAFDALPERKLIPNDLERDGAVCAIGAVGRQRGVDMSAINPEDAETIAGTFGIAEALAREIEFLNDEGHYSTETPEARFERMRRWVASSIIEP